MTKDAKPYSLKRTFAIGLAAASAFALLSLFFLFMQVRSAHHRLAGEVIAVAEESVDIRNGRGEVTVLSVPAKAELRGVDSVEMLMIGQHLLVRGRFAEDGTFEVERLRVLEGEPRP